MRKPRLALPVVCVGILVTASLWNSRDTLTVLTTSSTAGTDLLSAAADVVFTTTINTVSSSSSTTGTGTTTTNPLQEIAAPPAGEANDDHKNQESNQPFTPATTASSAKANIDDLVEELVQCNITYHVYDNPSLEQWHYKQKILQLRPGKKPRKPLMMRRYGDEVWGELLILEALKHHPLRQAQQLQQQPEQPPQLYIIPLSLGVAVASARKASEAFDEALQFLYQQPTFPSTNTGKNGHSNHVLLSLLVPLHKYASPLRELNQHYPTLWNVTIANDVDWEGCQQLWQSGQARGHDFEPDIGLYRHNMARFGFSLGLLAPTRTDTEGGIPWISASYDKFRAAKYWIFYHTREAESLHNSTQYRHAPLQIDPNDLLKAQNQPSPQLLPASIGHDLPPTEWMERYTTSQFCLVIRGDTIHSHALMRAIKVGCIPVIVADFYPWFAPTFKSTIQMQDYAVFIEEKLFIEDPLKELLELREMSPHDIQEKLQWLAFAQRLFFPEHPDSLFVPAFLKEALRASRIPLGAATFPYNT